MQSQCSCSAPGLEEYQTMLLAISLKVERLTGSEAKATHITLSLNHPSLHSQPAYSPP